MWHPKAALYSDGKEPTRGLHPPTPPPSPPTNNYISHSLWRWLIKIFVNGRVQKFRLNLSREALARSRNFVILSQTYGGWWGEGGGVRVPPTPPSNGTYLLTPSYHTIFWWSSLGMRWKVCSFLGFPWSCSTSLGVQCTPPVYAVCSAVWRGRCWRQCALKNKELWSGKYIFFLRSI